MGRPRRFDEDALLVVAQDVFWTRGYTRASMEDVAAASGVGNGSLYAAYGSKSGLFLAAFDRYCHERSAFVESTLVGRADDVRVGIDEFFRSVIVDCVGQPNRRGCLMLNSIALVDALPDIAPIVTRTTREFERHVSDRIRRDLGEADGDFARISAHIVMLSQGFIERSRLGYSRDELIAIADSAATHLSAVLAEGRYSDA